MTWGDVFRKYITKGEDYSSAAERADRWEARCHLLPAGGPARRDLPSGARKWTVRPGAAPWRAQAAISRASSVSIHRRHSVPKVSGPL
jgi:hypothetical protein